MTDSSDQTQMVPVIRDFGPEDYEAVAVLWEATGMGGKHRGDGPEVIIRTLQAGGRFLVMEEKVSGSIIGTSWLTTDARRTYLHHFGILPAFQGRKLAGLLLEETLKAAREIGFQLKLEVHRANLTAAGLYRKYGFSYLGDYDVYIIREI